MSVADPTETRDFHARERHIINPMGTPAGDVIERFCKLQEEVMAAIGNGDAADCFCGRGGFWGTTWKTVRDVREGYRNDDVAIEFIEKAVRRALPPLVNRGHGG